MIQKELSPFNNLRHPRQIAGEEIAVMFDLHLYTEFLPVLGDGPDAVSLDGQENQEKRRDWSG